MQTESVAAAFATYRAQVLPAEASAVQVNECQRAFYAGAYFLLMNIAHNIGDESTPEEDGIVQLEALKAECEAFGAAGGPALEYPPTPPATLWKTGTDEVPYIVDEVAPLPPAILAKLAAAPADIHHDAPAPLVSEIRLLLERLGHGIGDDLPAGWGFALFLFTFGAGGHTFYIANAQRADLLVMLHDFIRRQTS